MPRGHFAPPAPFAGQRRSSGAQPKPGVAPQPPLSPRLSRLLTATVQCSAETKTSKFASDTASSSGQIYGIWKNEKYPGKVVDSALTKAKCLYVGKTARGEDLGTRFVDHVRDDTSAPWSLAQGASYDEHDDTVWPYVVRNIWKFADITAFDVAVAEQYYIQDFLAGGAKLTNAINAITPEKFADYKDTDAFTTKKLYPSSWKPVDIKK